MAKVETKSIKNVQERFGNKLDTCSDEVMPHPEDRKK